MKKILFILFVAQFVLSPCLVKSYSINFIENSRGYSAVNQDRKTIRKDIFDNTIVEDNKGNRKTIKKDMLEDDTLEDLKSQFGM